MNVKLRAMYIYKTPWKVHLEPSGISSLSVKAFGTGHYTGVSAIRYVAARIIYAWQRTGVDLRGIVYILK